MAEDRTLTDGRLADRLNELVDTDPLKLRDQAHALLLRAQRAEAREGTLRATMDAAIARANEATRLAEQLTAAYATLRPVARGDTLAQLANHAAQQIANHSAEARRLLGARDETITQLRAERDELEARLDHEAVLARETGAQRVAERDAARAELAEAREQGAARDLLAEQVQALAPAVARWKQSVRDNGEYYNRTGAKYENGKATAFDAAVTEVEEIFGRALDGGEATR